MARITEKRQRSLGQGAPQRMHLMLFGSAFMPTCVVSWHVVCHQRPSHKAFWRAPLKTDRY